MAEKQKKLIKNRPDMLQVRRTGEIKFKDKASRNRLNIDMRKVFGFLPEILIIDKVIGKNNTIVISAIIPDEQLKAESNRKESKSVAGSPGKADSATAPDG